MDGVDRMKEMARGADASGPNGASDGGAGLAARFLAGGGEMGARCRAFDWNTTPLGPVAQWPQSLRTTAALVLGSAFPTILCWGPELVQLYNDGYIPVHGLKHPWGLGRPTREVWPEVWHLNAPLFARALAGETVSLTDAPYALARKGPHAPPDDVFVSLSFSPVRDEAAAVGGVLVTLVDTTAEVVNRQLAAELAAANRELAQFKLAVEHSNDAQFLNDEDGRIRWANRLACERLGYTFAELTALSIADIDPMFPPGSFAQYFERARRGPVNPFESVHRRKDASTFPVEITPTVVDVAEGPRMLSAVRDISERRVAEAERERLLVAERAARERTSTILESIGDAFYAVDADFRFTYVNRKAEELWGRQRQNLVGRHYWTEFPEAVESESAQMHRRAMAERRPAHYETVSPIVGRWVDVSLYPDSGGGLSCYVRDVSERKQAEAELRTSAATLRGFLDHAPVLMGVVELAHEGGHDDIVHVYDNPATSRFFGAAPGSTAGRRASELGVPAAVIATWARHYRAAEAAGAPVAFEYTFDTPAGPRWLAVTVSMIGPAPAGRTRFTYVAEDATVRKQAQVERERLLAAAEAARAEAEAASRVKSQFLAVMSHELRTPLNAIGGYAELMEMGIRGPITPEQREDLGRIQMSQRHLLGLINEVLNYAKLETGAVAYHLSNVPLAEAVGAAEVLVAPQLRAKGLAYGTTGCGPGIVARADPDKLRQILLNLLSNAIKFTNARPGLHGRVDVACAADGARAYVTVSDTGIGIPADKLQAIFEPFVQVDARLTRPHEGTGLGLAISRDLARGMGGDLTAESVAGVGSRFTLALPCAP